MTFQRSIVLSFVLAAGAVACHHDNSAGTTPSNANTAPMSNDPAGPNGTDPNAMGPNTPGTSTGSMVNSGAATGTTTTTTPAQPGGVVTPPPPTPTPTPH